jgi:hypothetical protein
MFPADRNPLNSSHLLSDWGRRQMMTFLIQTEMKWQRVCGRTCGLWNDSNNERFSALAWMSSLRYCKLLPEEQTLQFLFLRNKFFETFSFSPQIHGYGDG